MFQRFINNEDGLVTIDWVVILAGLTALGVYMTDQLGDALGEHSQKMRGELQDPHFDTTWFDYVAVKPPGME